MDMNLLDQSMFRVPYSYSISSLAFVLCLSLSVSTLSFCQFILFVADDKEFGEGVKKVDSKL